MRKSASKKGPGKKPAFVGVRTKGGSVEVVREVMSRKGGARMVRTVTSGLTKKLKKGPAKDWLADDRLGDELLRAFSSSVKRAKGHSAR